MKCLAAKTLTNIIRPLKKELLIKQQHSGALKYQLLNSVFVRQEEEARGTRVIQGRDIASFSGYDQLFFHKNKIRP